MYTSDMSKISTAEIRSSFADVLNRASYAKERVTITRHGRNIAAIVPIEDVEMLEAIEDKMDLEIARKALQEVEHRGSVSWKELKAALGE